MEGTAFIRLDIRMARSFCAHSPYKDGILQWKWQLYTDMQDGITRHGMSITCDVCSSTLHILPEDLVGAFVIEKKKAAPKPQPGTADTQPVVEPRHRVHHERQFTPFDEKLLKTMRIHVDPDEIKRS